ncbi:hypothetical protein VN97_g11880 [Penicillium thymicola]|uniref:Uncharacterized protein n=1 Tax=Penicillium thymicola TaxID=293382 RepID=A0AAI9X2M1_PENTH|nr:hypothetical protein VN97_g11880 [Penicillium thymicola]
MIVLHISLIPMSRPPTTILLINFLLHFYRYLIPVLELKLTVSPRKTFFIPTMSHPAQIQQPTGNIHTMFPGSGNVESMSNETLVDSYRSLDPSRASLEDYNRSMLQYTQRQMSSFVDTDDLRRDSQSSGKSGRSIASSGSNISRQATASFTPVSNTPLLAETKRFVLSPLLLLLLLLLFLLFLLCDEPTLSQSRGHWTVPRRKYTLLRYHIAVLAIDDLYNYTQSTRSNLVFILLICVYFFIASFFGCWLRSRDEFIGTFIPFMRYASILS